MEIYYETHRNMILMSKFISTYLTFHFSNNQYNETDRENLHTKFTFSLSAQSIRNVSIVSTMSTVKKNEFCMRLISARETNGDYLLLLDKEYCPCFRYWCATHVLQTQYTIQIIRCNSISCCGPWRSNYIQVFPHRFLPAPVAFERTPRGIAMAERDYQKGVFYGSLIQRIQFHGVVMQHTQNDVLPFDYCCSSVRKELKRRVCSICKQYIPSAYRMKNHYKIHQQQYASNCLEYDEDMFSNETGTEDEQNPDENTDMLSSQRPLPAVSDPSSNGVVIFSDMLDWLKSDFEELELKEQILRETDKKKEIN